MNSNFETHTLEHFSIGASVMGPHNMSEHCADHYYESVELTLSLLE